MNYKYDPILMMNVPEEGTKTQDASRGHEIVVKTENYLKSIGKNNSVGKYDKVVRGVKSLLEQGFLEGPELERAIKQEADKLLKKYSLDSAIEATDAKSDVLQTKNGYTLGINSAGKLVIAFKGETLENPHMYLGEPNQANMNKAVKLFEELANGKTHDSSVNDFSSSDAKAVFDYIDRQFTKDMNEYPRRIANAKTQDECERIEEMLRKDLDNIVDEYIQIWNQVGQYAQKRKNDAVTRYGELMSSAFKKYNELGRK